MPNAKLITTLVATSLFATAAPSFAGAQERAITAADLHARVTAFAHDSMQGRAPGTSGYDRATSHLAAELKRIGLRPGVRGSYFQDVRLVRRSVAPEALLQVRSHTFTSGNDYLPANQRGNVREVEGRYPTLYGGTFAQLRTIPREQITGKIVVLAADRSSFSANALDPAEPFAHAAAIILPVLESSSATQRAQLPAPVLLIPPGSDATSPPIFVVTRDVAARILGHPLETAQLGSAGQEVGARLRFNRADVPSRNVVAVLPGSDPQLKGQYVAIGAHADHVGIAPRPLEHDSLKAWLAARRQLLLALDTDADEILTPEQQQTLTQQLAALRINTDSLRALRPPRLDSIFNGAEDNASGSMAILEIAEELAARPRAPRRSLLFVWYTAEESGLLGSEYFVSNPTVPRDSIIANVNLDHGGGRASALDHRNGGPEYINLIGSGRLSSQLDSLVQAVNATQPRPFRFDRALDRPGHVQNIFCRSDHASYARRGIPVVVFSSLLFSDYHQLTDEAQYLDYEHMARVTKLTRDVVLALADLPRRLILDGERPDASTACRQ